MAMILDNIVIGLSISPFHEIQFTLIMILIFAAFALVVGSYGRIFKFQLLRTRRALILPFTMVIFPSFIEEVVFRGVLIPRSCFSGSMLEKSAFLILSSLIFVGCHPVNARFFYHKARDFFYNPYFLTIAFALGLTCGLSYIISGSLWASILMHWIAVVVWVFFLGGRNFMKDV